MTDTRWSRADRAGAALQAHVDERKGIGSTYGDEGSDEWRANVLALLVDLKYMLDRADYTLMLTDLAEEAVDIWAEEADTLPKGGDEEGDDD